MSNHLIIYTAVFGRYDLIKGPSCNHIPDGTKFICLTDDGNITHSGYDQGYESRIVKCTIGGPRLCSRRCKINSHVMFPETGITIWHGGNVQLRGNIKSLIGLAKDSGIAVLKHNLRNCAYDEAQACISQKKDSREIIGKQIKRYANESYPKNYGLSAAFLLVRYNRPGINELNELWWREVSTGSIRDQISFDYCCWKLGIKPAIIPGDIFKGPYHMRNPIHNKR